jgi:RHS repeat-associated protein
VQSTEYYPFGMPYADEVGRGVQPYKFGNKELDDMNGLNWLDFEERMQAFDVSRFMTIDPLAEKYYSISPYAYCLNNPVNAIDPNGMEVYYLSDGTRLGQLGDNEDIRVINAQMRTNDARAHFESGSDESISALMDGSVAFADYFTNVSDVTNGATVVSYSGNCYDAAATQMENEGYGVAGSKASSTIFTNVGVSTDNPNNLAENVVGGAIKIMTDLKSGKPVMVGVAQSNDTGNFNMQWGNTNPRTSHFIVINSSIAGSVAVSFGYLDNASGSGPLNLNTSTGGITGGITGRGLVKTYSVSEVRSSWKIRK